MRRRPPLLLWLGMFFLLRRLMGRRHIRGGYRSGWSPYGGGWGGRHYF